MSLDRLADLVSAQALIDLEVAHLVDVLAAHGTSWPAIASVLRVSRQFARPHPTAEPANRPSGFFPSCSSFSCRLPTANVSGWQTRPVTSPPVNAG